MSVGSRLKSQRQRRGYTQVQLAELARVSQPLIARLEKDHIREPAAKPLGRIARALGCSLDWLIGMYDEGEEHATPLVGATAAD